MARIKAWKFDDPEQPDFPSDFKIERKAVLQVTDIKTNRNKYYAIELHSAGGNFRVFTHYGRTDDLENNPNSGQKECRYHGDAASATANYEQIYRQKTSASKGYKEVSLASSNIGSQQARGTSSGDVDQKTLEKMEEAKKKTVKKKPKPAPSLDLHPDVRDLVQYLFSEATSALTNTVQAKITAKGIETPLGILTLGQIERGQGILQDIYKILGAKKPKQRQERLETLTGEFYTVIPHRIGRTRDAVAAAVITTLEDFAQKQETLQLMEDMLQVNGDGEEAVLYNQEVDSQYLSLKAILEPVDPKSKDYKRLGKYVVKSQIKSKSVKVKRIFKVVRPGEADVFTDHIGNEQLLFHGSRIQNWVGLISRGILMPKVAVKLGVNRTDAGWLGNGIYFGDAACTSTFYTTPGNKRTRVMAICNVALGKMMEYRKITYGITGPPDGYDSCHGVRHKPLRPSNFADDEFVIYNQNQQRMDYLVEFTD